MEYLRNRDELGIRRTGGVELGDARRTKRLIRLMEGLWAHPSGHIPVASGGFAQTKAAYRLLENPVLEWREILEVHTQRTVERIAGQAVALCIQDTTALDFTSQPGIAGLGRLSYEAITWLVCPSDLGGHAPRAGAGGGGCLDVGAQAQRRSGGQGKGALGGRV